MLSDPVRDQAGGPARQRPFDHLSAGERHLGLVLSIARVQMRSSKYR